MKNLALFCIGLGCVFYAHAQLGAKAQQNIYGTWHNNDFGYQMTLILQSDGSGEFDGEVIRQRIQGNSLLITQEGTTTTYQFILTGNSLTVSGGDLDAPIVFVRNGSSVSQTKVTNASTSAVAKSPLDLVGVWTNYGESIEFKSNAQCIYLGQAYPYQVAGNQITLQTAQGNFVMVYALKGNQLNLTVNGTQLSYTRGQSSVTGGNTTSTQSGNKQRDMTLVGKWCYVNVTSTNSGGTSSDECITIHENGTYEYYSERSMSSNTNTFSSGTSSQSSDSGTWWVQGNRVYYQSQTQGTGSYELKKQNHPKTGDPMIVLDGTAYVTYYQKAPW